ncbi:DUF6782 family putative metallopeptidase [Thioclava atlantica]|uniref:DUF6782 domain-containing protein n=1 Tax=Thioclava atlantica TaxID=1317124 RepID=A0A085TSX5_9RHOB|nr:DUF6782 family putative metallopeptidase [Thioclava atlantica]KFE33822.1 hypothetical protein DW2_16380 [Thioclava atlantica]
MRAARRGLLALGFVCLAHPTFAQEMTCAAPPFDSSPEIAALVDRLDPVLTRWPALGTTLFRDTRELCLADTLHDARGYLEPEACRIIIAADLDPELQAVVLIHELRHLQQKFCGTCPEPTLSMHENARAIFAIEADAAAYSLAIAWQLRADGQPGMWDALAGWPMQADIAAAFEAEMKTSNDLSAAASAAFAQWYREEKRQELYYTAACSDYLERIDREHNLLTYDALAPDFFARLCHLPDGAAYQCGEPD